MWNRGKTKMEYVAFHSSTKPMVTLTSRVLPENKHTLLILFCNANTFYNFDYIIHFDIQDSLHI